MFTAIDVSGSVKLRKVVALAAGEVANQLPMALCRGKIMTASRDGHGRMIGVKASAHIDLNTVSRTWAAGEPQARNESWNAAQRLWIVGDGAARCSSFQPFEVIGFVSHVITRDMVWRCSHDTLSTSNTRTSAPLVYFSSTTTTCSCRRRAGAT